MRGAQRILAMNNNDILVSIIVPVYNAENYLPKCLDSLIAQTLSAIEIICVNDGSVDNSLKILEEYSKKDSRIVVVNQQNKGVSSARNVGLELAKGEFVGFVDSDDWIDCDYYEKLYNYAKEYNSEMSACSILRHRKHNKKFFVKYDKVAYYTEPSEIVQVAKIPQWNYTVNKIYKLTSLKSLNVTFPEGKLFEDVYWSPRVVSQLKGLVTVPSITYHYRATAGSIVDRSSKKHREDLEWAILQSVNFLEQNNIKIMNKCSIGAKTYIKILGAKLFTIEHFYPKNTLYKLFGFIPFLTIEEKQ